MSDLNNIEKLNPLTRFCMTIGQIPTSYLVSMSYEEQLLWLCDYLKNKVIPAVNNNADCVTELQNLYKVLKNYVDNYFDNLDVQEEINNKLDEMAENGTLAEIINQEVFSEINDKIFNIERNSKWIAPLFLDTEYRQSEEYFRNFLNLCINAGFKESQMLIHIRTDGTLLENKNLFTLYNNIANELKIPITSVKFHGKYTSINYQNLILECLSYFPNANTVFIFNENIVDVSEHGLDYPSVIKNNYQNIKKVGFTMQYDGIFRSQITAEKWTALNNVYDILGVHMYPSISTYDDAKNVTFDKVIESFNNPNFIIAWNKEIWITESGVLPYWQALELPENYDTSKFSDNTKTLEPQYIFFKGLAKSNIAQKAKKICPWYLESGVPSNMTDLFNVVLKSIIKGE